MRQKIILLLLCCIAIGELHAQEKGEMFWGGKAGIGIQSHMDSEVYASFNLAPEFGYFVAKNFRIGAQVEYGIFNVDSAYHLFTIGPRFAYYVKLVDRLYYVPEIGFYGAMGVDGGYTAGGIGVDINLFSLEFRPTSRIGLALNVASLQYINMNEVDSLELNLAGSTQIGFRYYF